MNRHVAGDLYQIGSSVAGENGMHEAVRVYVLLNDGCPLIFDAGSHLHRQNIMADLMSLLGDTAPGYVFLTHTELPHTGNLRVILDQWPDTKIVVSNAILPYCELPWWLKPEQVEFALSGNHYTYGNREMFFLDGILKDQPGTHWMFDNQTGTLFTADAFGYFFPEEAEHKFADEITDGIDQNWFKHYHESAFRFLPYVYGVKVNADVAKTFLKREVQVIAPTHGNAIRKDITENLAIFNNAILEICR